MNKRNIFIDNNNIQKVFNDIEVTLNQKFCHEFRNDKNERNMNFRTSHARPFLLDYHFEFLPELRLTLANKYFYKVLQSVTNITTSFNNT